MFIIRIIDISNIINTDKIHILNILYGYIIEWKLYSIIILIIIKCYYYL